MENSQNISIVKKLHDEVYTKGNLAALDQLLANDLKLIDPAAPNFKGGLASYRERESAYKTAFPNKTAKIDDIFSTEDGRIVVRWTVQGTQKGRFHDIEPTGKNFKISGLSIYRLAGGKISEIVQFWDRLGLLEQLGVVEASQALHR